MFASASSQHVEYVVHGRSTVAGRNMHENNSVSAKGATAKVSRHQQPVTSKPSVG